MTPTPLSTLTEVKLAWARGEKVEYLVTTGTWIEWTDSTAIDTGFSDHWRVSPTITRAYIYGVRWAQKGSGPCVWVNSNPSREDLEIAREKDIELGATCSPIVEVDLEIPA